MSQLNKKKIKICIVSFFIYPLYNRRYYSYFGVGGAEIQLYLLSKEFAKKKEFDVNIITGRFEPLNRRFELINNQKIFKIIPIKRNIINFIRAIILLFVFLKKIDPDIIIQRCAGVITGLCAFYCKLFNKKLIFSIANKPDVDGEAEKGIKGKIYRFGINNTNFIVAQNKEQIALLESYKKKKLIIFEL